MAADLEPNRLTPHDRLLVRHLAEAIEANVGAGAIFVLVAPPSKREGCARALLDALPGYNERLIPSGADVLPALIQADVAERTLFSLPTYTLDSSALKATLQSLNYRRELVAENDITLLLWLEESGLGALPRHAKDFWSFRTATYRFDAPLAVSKGEIPDLTDRRAEIADTERLLHEAEGSGATPAELGPLYSRLGVQLYDIPDLGRALEALQLAEANYASAGDERNRAATLDNIGVVYQAKGDLETALKAQERALAIHRELGDRKGEAIGLGHIGVVYQVKGKLEAALKTQQEALAIHRENGQRLGVANALASLGLVYKDQGDLERARNTLEEALAIHREIGYRKGVVDALVNIASVHREMGNLETASRADEEREEYEKNKRPFASRGTIPLLD